MNKSVLEELRALGAIGVAQTSNSFECPSEPVASNSIVLPESEPEVETLAVDATPISMELLAHIAEMCGKAVDALEKMQEGQRELGEVFEEIRGFALEVVEQFGSAEESRDEEYEEGALEDSNDSEQESEEIQIDIESAPEPELELAIQPKRNPTTEDLLVDLVREGTGATEENHVSL